MKGKYLKYLRMLREVEFGPYPQVDSLIRHRREVPRRHFLPTLVVVLALAGLAGLNTAVADPSVTVLAAGAATGVYQISCLTTFPTQPCLPGPTANSYETRVDTAVLLNAHVTDSSGTLAGSGLLIFQDCLLKGIPAPSIECDSGSGLWSHIQTVRIIEPVPISDRVDIRIAYGIVSTPQTIGFRFRYLGQGSGIANGISNSMDVTWF
jgi:hypothetical protein